ncbi:hypothetical protein HPB51_011515 [Rhipicephalus microplus]|uniref:Uncharacterized protein n=1 Tax=Rhipicephalus microplus TaxID=6941 RepID=A0A9J6E822_RHIMP|nr:hypothetical protein HPB51_011515 [Rhipicephalus microplus]
MVFTQNDVAEVQPPDSGEHSLIQAALVWILGVVVGGVLGVSCVMLLEFSTAHVTEHETASTTRESSVTSSTSAIPVPSTKTSTQVPPINRSICFSHACLKASRRMQKLLNPLADPCRNWYEHVCGRFEGPQASVHQLMDTAVAKSVRKSLLAFGRDPPASIAPGVDARLKAAKLLLACEATEVEFVENTDVINFMAREKLDILVSASADATADEVFSKHVDLAFRYALSGLMTLSPGAQMLTLEVDGSLEARVTAFHDMGSSALFEYLVNLAEFVGQPEEEAKVAVMLHNTLVTAVTSIMVHAHGRSESSTRRGAVMELRASQVMFNGVGSSTFGDAVERHTPYSKDVDVDCSDVALLVLEAAWKALTPAELAAWTAWTVLHECASIAVTYLAAFFDSATLRHNCAARVRHVMSVPFAAVALFDVVTRKIQDDVTEMTKLIFDCLARNASHYLRSPVLSSVIVGFPPARDTVAGIDAYYAAFPEAALLEFFKEWVASADARKDKLLPPEVYFDPSKTNVIVSRQGTVIVPAGIFKTELYKPGVVEALNDCRRRGTGVLGSCDTDTMGNFLSFSEAFDCKNTTPSCVLP